MDEPTIMADVVLPEHTLWSAMLYRCSHRHTRPQGEIYGFDTARVRQPVPQLLYAVNAMPYSAKSPGENWDHARQGRVYDH